MKDQQQKDDTIRPDGRHGDKKIRGQRYSSYRAKKTKPAVARPAGGPRTTLEAQRRTETNG